MPAAPSDSPPSTAAVPAFDAGSGRSLSGVPELAPSDAALLRARARRRTLLRGRREYVAVAVVVLFVLNSLNGRMIVKSVNSRFEDLSNYYYAQPEPTAAKGEGDNEDTAIIITSSSVPSHPSTHMVETVMNSTVQLKGLSPTAPVFITVDHFRWSDFANLPGNLKHRIDTLEEYALNLHSRYLRDPRVHVVPNLRNLHIAGSTVKALNLIGHHYPSVEYVYYLQHDFFFARPVDHAALINAMNEDERINYVRFPKKAPWLLNRECGKEPAIYINRTVTPGDADASKVIDSDEGEAADGIPRNETRPRYDPDKITLHPTNAYSDNNHLARFKWYRRLLLSIQKLDRTPENPLQVRANQGCRNPHRRLGLYLWPEHCIGHLRGRQTVDFESKDRRDRGLGPGLSQGGRWAECGDGACDGHR